MVELESERGFAWCRVSFFSYDPVKMVLTFEPSNCIYQQLMITIDQLTSKQLRQAISIKDKIAVLETKLNQLFGSPTAQPVAAKTPKKRKMSAAGKARIAAAQKARWAKVNAGKSAAKPVKKARRKMSAAAKAKIGAAAKARWAKIKAQGKKSL